MLLSTFKKVNTEFRTRYNVCENGDYDSFVVDYFKPGKESNIDKLHKLLEKKATVAFVSVWTDGMLAIDVDIH